MATEITLIEKLQENVDALKASVAGLESQVNELMDLEKGEMTAAAVTESSHIGLTLFVFALAIFLGVELITKVPSQLHTPLMSGSNAISGITIVGAVIALQNLPQGNVMIPIIGFLAVVTASINVVGGYLVTDRMLGMFKSKKGGE